MEDSTLFQTHKFIKCDNLDNWINDTKIKMRFVAIHLNIRSLKKNFNSFIAQINDVLQFIDVIFLTEINTKNETISMFNIPNFIAIANTRENRRGGGLIMYLKNHHTFKETNISFKSCEAICGQITTVCQDSINILAVYRPPSSNKNIYLKELKQILQMTSSDANYLYCGDINLNLLDTKNSVITEYQNLLSENGLESVILDVTRDEILNGKNVYSCIDHIAIRNRYNTVFSCIVTNKISDHYITGVAIGKEVITKDLNKKREIIDNKLVYSKLKLVNWGKLLQTECPSELYYTLKNVFDNIYASSKKEISFKNNLRHSNPWVTEEIKNMINKRDYLYRKCKNSPNNPVFRLEYTRYRNKTNKHINITKNAFHKNVINSLNGNPRKLWDEINNLIGKPKQNLDKIILQHMGNQGDTKFLCDKFATTFVNEIKDIRHNCTTKFLDRNMYTTPAIMSMRFRPVSEKDVKKIINDMDIKKSEGNDQIRIKDLKLIADNIIPVLTKLINLCVSKSIMPDELKTSIIRPIYKSGNHKEFTNYRPIAILSCIDKIIERAIFNQIQCFIEKNRIINPTQYGFQKEKSTTQLLSKFTDHINCHLNEKYYVGIIFIDFKKAFDTLDHQTLLKAMEECGIRGPLKNMFKNYLLNRKIKVKIDGIFSDEMLTDTGVATGSISGPTCYIMQVNSLPNVIKRCKCYMFADDTCIICADRNIQKIEEFLQTDLNNIIKWSHDNGIILNAKKNKIYAYTLSICKLSG